MRSSSVPRLDEGKFWQKHFELFDANGWTNVQTMANSIVAIPHFVRQETTIPMQLFLSQKKSLAGEGRNNI